MKSVHNNNCTHEQVVFLLHIIKNYNNNRSVDDHFIITMNNLHYIQQFCYLFFCILYLKAPSFYFSFSFFPDIINGTSFITLSSFCVSLTSKRSIGMVAADKNDALSHKTVYRLQRYSIYTYSRQQKMYDTLIQNKSLYY